MPRGVVGNSEVGLGCRSRIGTEDLRSVPSVSTDALLGKAQFLSTASPDTPLAVDPFGKAIGAGRGTPACFSTNSGSSLMPISPTRSASLPQFLVVSARRGTVVDRSKLLCPPVLPNRKRCFFVPRSRTKEPRTSALATAAAARISSEARRERNRWSECRTMTPSTRYMVIPTKMSESANRRTREIFLVFISSRSGLIKDLRAHLCGGMVDLRTIGIGKPTISRSVITSLVPIVKS